MCFSSIGQPGQGDSGDDADAEPTKPIQSQAAEAQEGQPESMRHLCVDQLILIMEISTAYAKFVEQHGTDRDDLPPFMLGAVSQGVPTDPSKPTTCGSFVPNLPYPNLGVLPRQEIIKELEADSAKNVKQRRDLSGANQSTEACIS